MRVRLFVYVGVMAAIFSLSNGTGSPPMASAQAKHTEEIARLHQNILYPTVRVRAQRSVGSGTIVASIKNGDRYDTYVLTNHHVIENAIEIKEEWSPLLKAMVKKETRSTVEIEQFKYQHMSQATGTLLILADIVEWNMGHDLALIKLRSDDKFPTATLLPRGKESDLRIFQDVYVCGSGLGRSPFPTSGIVSSLVDEIDNQPYWMVSAPSVFGNSGGGCFLSATHEFIGIPSRIPVTWTSWSPNAVYHMAYVIPISRIYSWLYETGWGFLFDPSAPSREKWLADKKKGENKP